VLQSQIGCIVKKARKKGGAIVILNIAISANLLHLIAIYDESERSKKRPKELEELLEYTE